MRTEWVASHAQSSSLITQSPFRRSDVTKERVVIADDESIIRMDLREMLGGLGYQVVGEAADGRRVLELARTLRPDLVIMDIKMPEVDGITAAETLTQEKVA